jgi:hypothetical protein
MTNAERLQAALGRPDPARNLRNVVEKLLAEGCLPSETQALLERLLLDVRAHKDRAADEDAVLDVLDGLAGWCHEEARISPKS